MLLKMNFLPKLEKDSFSSWIFMIDIFLAYFLCKKICLEVGFAVLASAGRLVLRRWHREVFKS